MYDTLDKTIYGMVSKDYKERFKAEYAQIVIRIEKLEEILVNYSYYAQKFPNISSNSILDAQLKAMRNYRDVLQLRADYEGIELD